MKIGNANYSGGYKKKKYFKLKDGENVYRILPPLGALADEGRWSMFYNVHYGYKNSKGENRPFQSPLVQNKKTKMIDAADPALERLEKGKAALEKAKAANDLPMIERLSKLFGNGKILAQFNMDNNHHVNAINMQGEIGTLQLRHRCKVALDAEIKRLNAAGVDPLSVENGRVFVFRRSGVGLDTVFAVSVLKKKMTIEGVGEVEQEVVHKLTPDIISRLGSEAAQLEKLFKRPTSEEVARIVKEGATAVDEIFDSPKTGVAVAQETPPADDAPGSDYEEPKAGVAAATVAITPIQTVTPVQSASPVHVAIAQAVAPKVEVKPSVTVIEQSDDDFLASLN